jgi:hypothetical protein
MAAVGLAGLTAAYLLASSKTREAGLDIEVHLFEKVCIFPYHLYASLNAYHIAGFCAGHGCSFHLCHGTRPR